MIIPDTNINVTHKNAVIRLSLLNQEHKIDTIRERARSALLMAGIKDKDIRKFISLSFKTNTVEELCEIISKTMLIVDDNKPAFWGIPRKIGHGGFLVYGPDGYALDVNPSLAVMNHSPTGFAWGYNGSGPAQLALAILLCLVSEKEALDKYHQFKDKFIATNPMDNAIILYEKDILNWISNN